MRYELRTMCLPIILVKSKGRGHSPAFSLGAGSTNELLQQRSSDAAPVPDAVHRVEYHAAMLDSATARAVLTIDHDTVQVMRVRLGEYRRDPHHRIYFGKLRKKPFAGSMTLDDIETVSADNGFRPPRPVLRYKDGVLAVDSVKNAAVMQVQATDTSGTWFLPVFNSGPVPACSRFGAYTPLCLGFEQDSHLPVGWLCGCDPGRAELTTHTVPSGVTPTRPYLYRIRVRSVPEYWSRWSEPVRAVPAARMVSHAKVDTIGAPVQRIEIASTESRRRMTKIVPDHWYQLSLDLPPNLSDTVVSGVDILLNADPNRQWLCYQQRGGPFDPRRNYLFSYSLDQGLLWGREEPGETEMVFISGKTGRYLDGTDGAVAYEPTEGRLRLRFRLDTAARRGAWVVAAYTRNKDLAVSTPTTAVFHVGPTEATAEGVVRWWPAALGISLMLLAAGWVVRYKAARHRFRQSTRRKPPEQRPSGEQGVMDPAPHDPRVPHGEKVDQAKRFMREHVGEKIATREIARALCITPNWLSKLFKQATGTTVVNYLAMLRVQRAKHLLADSSRSVSDIAFECGFSSPNYP